MKVIQWRVGRERGREREREGGKEDRQHYRERQRQNERDPKTSLHARVCGEGDQRMDQVPEYGVSCFCF